jgi:hypothetical protein
MKPLLITSFVFATLFHIMANAQVVDAPADQNAIFPKR